MNGYEIYDRAALRLGYKGTSGEEVLDDRLVLRALEFINQIALDLKLKTVKDLSEEINVTDDMVEALCCGTAMMLSLSEGDTTKNAVFTALYNAKRMAMLSKNERVEDILPVAEG